MPFKSEKQKRYMYANFPKIAKKWSGKSKKEAIRRRMKNGNKHSKTSAS